MFRVVGSVVVECVCVCVCVRVRACVRVCLAAVRCCLSFLGDVWRAGFGECCEVVCVQGLWKGCCRMLCVMEGICVCMCYL